MLTVEAAAPEAVVLAVPARTGPGLPGPTLAMAVGAWARARVTPHPGRHVEVRRAGAGHPVSAADPRSLPAAGPWRPVALAFALAPPTKGVRVELRGSGVSLALALLAGLNVLSRPVRSGRQLARQAAEIDGLAHRDPDPAGAFAAAFGGLQAVAALPPDGREPPADPLGDGPWCEPLPAPPWLAQRLVVARSPRPSAAVRPVPAADTRALCAALRAGDEEGFAEQLRRSWGADPGAGRDDGRIPGVSAAARWRSWHLILCARGAADEVRAGLARRGWIPAPAPEGEGLRVVIRGPGGTAPPR
jgi:hypothetical protein